MSFLRTLCVSMKPDSLHRMMWNDLAKSMLVCCRTSNYDTRERTVILHQTCFAVLQFPLSNVIFPFKRMACLVDCHIHNQKITKYSSFLAYPGCPDSLLLPKIPPAVCDPPRSQNVSTHNFGFLPQIGYGYNCNTHQNWHVTVHFYNKLYQWTVQN